VAQIKTKAVLTPDGKHYVLNGVKKWITGGMFADYFTVLAQTVDENGKVIKRTLQSFKLFLTCYVPSSHRLLYLFCCSVLISSPICLSVCQSFFLRFLY
jgi:hypothetical protein